MKSKWYIETTADMPKHAYLLDSSKSKCFAYRTFSDKSKEKIFIKPLKFDARRRSFKEI